MYMKLFRDPNLVFALDRSQIDAAAIFSGEVVLQEALAHRLHLVVFILLRNEEDAQSTVTVQSELASLGILRRHCDSKSDCLSYSLP